MHVSGQGHQREELSAYSTYYRAAAVNQSGADSLRSDSLARLVDSLVPDPANFTVTGYNVGATCTATESGVPAGYTGNVAGCASVPVTTGSCTIVNTLNSATFTVNKDFVPNLASLGAEIRTVASSSNSFRRTAATGATHCGLTTYTPSTRSK